MRTPIEPIPLRATPSLRARWEAFAPGVPFPATAHEISVAMRTRLRLWDPDLLEAFYSGSPPKRRQIVSRRQVDEIRQQLEAVRQREQLKEQRSAAQKGRKVRKAIDMEAVLLNGAEVSRLAIEKLLRQNNGLNPWAGEGYSKRLQKAIERIDEETALKLKKEAAIAAALNTTTKRPNIRSAPLLPSKGAIPRGVLA
ncbi:hypothetical protein [Synechococcus sp. CCAP 1479/9]|uniref:hypothetical protein n=1 Tax=Synechococcus sp. CCAP 1479/9 TaxID=1221593 RepID=UPI001C24B040|nr:hypothetical protein [Synechococcus sp. CCAP 1479/9]